MSEEINKMSSQEEREKHFPEDSHAPKQQKENMEMHKHPHHVTHSKKWHEYLLEFFMLFLAVFLGFLVENYREHKVELERTEKHMHTMVENLKYDTTRYGINLRANLSICRGIDSFRYQIDEAIDGKTNPNTLYYFYWKYGRNYSNPVINNEAMSQLKSSGMLRMVKNDSLLKEIGDYYERFISNLDNVRSSLSKTRDQLVGTERLLFDFHGFDEILERDTVWTGTSSFFENYYAGIIGRKPALKLLNTDAQNFKNLYNDLAAVEWALRSFNAYMRYCHKNADSLMKHIKEEYDFQ